MTGHFIKCAWVEEDKQVTWKISHGCPHIPLEQPDIKILGYSINEEPFVMFVDEPEPIIKISLIERIRRWFE